MTSTSKKRKFLPRGTDYLGDLASKLRDLVGYTSLAHELIQNADDSSGATEISFDFRVEGLVVDNDGLFASCDEIDADECPWKSDVSLNRMCDFHRFRRVASGDKRNQGDTTGAFGIGFISVYQITDQPELISAGQHWIVQDSSIEAERIEVCGGCPQCQGSNLPGTRFFLPWAENPSSPLRKALSAGIVTAEDRKHLREELERNLMPAMLFLRNIRAISIKKDGVLSRKLTKEADDGEVVIIDRQKRQEWILLEGEFTQVAHSLRQKYGDRIEEKRKAGVTVAIPKGRLSSGLLYAYLPTQHSTGFQFHINADFFPSSDRKRVILEQDYQSEWNRAAISAAAEVLSDYIGELPVKLGHKRLWEVISSCESVSRTEPTGTFTVFWQHVRSELAQHDLIFTTERHWTSAAESLLLEKPRDEGVALRILEQLGLKIVHEDLRSHFNILTSKEVGVGLVDIPHITDRLNELGLSSRVERSDLPNFLKSRSSFDTLLNELSLLLARRRDAQTQKQMEQEVSSCALASGIDGALWPCAEVFRSDEATINLFTPIDRRIPFASKIKHDRIAALCPEFDAAVAIETLARLTEADFETASVEGRFAPDKLIEWFEDRREPVLASPEIKKQLAELPIFPTANTLRPLLELALPGDFDDPLGLANILNIERLGGRREFLQDLGALQLTFETYVEVHVPLAFSRDSLPNDKRHQVGELIATRLGEIRDNRSIERKLTLLELVECEDGEYRRAEVVYIRNQEIVNVLGESPHFTAIQGSHKDAIREFYLWLGVATQPRTSDIVSRVEELVSTTPTAASRQAIERIVHYCGRRFAQARDSFDVPGELSPLAWLPARLVADRWHRPNEVFAAFQAYLFESQARFLDLSPRVQQESVGFLETIGVRNTPTVLQVVNHLLHCISTNTPVNKDLYRFLNDHADDRSILSLKDKACLLLPNNTFVRPDQVFWTDHPFGPFRYVLGEELQKYSALFNRLEVKKSADYSDALAVIKEISQQYASTNTALDDDAHSALMASWQMLDQALDSGALVPDDLKPLHELKVVPNQERVLNPPIWMFFEDRAGLAAKFGSFLRDNAIPKPIGAWSAMGAAGLRSLSSAVEVQILECSDSLPDEKLLARLRGRSDQLSRVLEVQAGKETAVSARAILGKLACESVTDLRIRFLLHAFNRELKSEPEDVQAHYSREQGILYFRRDGDVPWSSIARELAIASLPDGEPGTLALGLREVLAADSEEALKATLDELGFASVEGPSVSVDAAAPTIGDLGVDDVPVFVGPVVTEESSPGPQGDGGLSPDDAVNRILGGNTPPPQPPPPELAEPPSAPGGGSGGGTKGTRRPTKSRKQSRRITYVTHNGSKEWDKPDEDASDKRSAIEEAGITRVVESERLEGRSPSIMPPRHPGYDIESKDPDGSIARFIEVKASSGVWGDRGVEVHRKQFDVARTKGEKYWLYVVEQADTDDYHIYAIQNPEDKVDDFIFDYGWRDVAEEEVEGDASGED
jgi:uncharacterized protein DUF3883